MIDSSLATRGCEPLDVEEGVARAGDDHAFYAELLDMFLDDVRGRLADLREAVAAHDSDRVASTAHSIKGAAANLSASPLRECALRLEMHARAGTLDDATRKVDELEAELRRLADFVQAL